MVDVRPEEISAILKQQLSGFSSATELEQVGTVLRQPFLYYFIDFKIYLLCKILIFNALC